MQQEELAMLKQELETVNSMFAEVDKRRVELQGQVNSMKDNYIQMNNQYYALKKQVSFLQGKNRMLTDKNENCLKQVECENEILVNALENRVSHLEALCDQYKQTVCHKKHEEDIPVDRTMAYFKDVIKKTRVSLTDVRLQWK